MAAGVPVVASNVHGILDYVIDGETGFTCSPDDVNGFASAILKLSNNYKLRLSMINKCRESVLKFDKSNSLSEMYKIYKEVLL